MTALPAGSNYSWSPNGDTTQSILAASAGNYSVSVTNSGGCSGIFNSLNTITTSVYPNPIANAGNDQNITPGNSVPIGAAATAGTSPYQYNWTPGIGLSSTTIYNPVVSNINATTNYIQTVMDANGCIDADTVTVFYSTCSYVVNPVQSPLYSASSASGNFSLSEAGSSCNPWNISNSCNFVTITSPTLPFSGNSNVFYTVDSNTTNMPRTCILTFPDGETYTINQAAAIANCILPDSVVVNYFPSLNQLVADNYLNCTYQWYLNGVILPNDTIRFLTTSLAGIYYVVVSCNGSTIQSNDIPIYTGINEILKKDISIYECPFCYQTNF